MTELPTRDQLALKRFAEIKEKRITAWANRLREDSMFPVATVATDGENEMSILFEEDICEEDMMDYLEEAMSMVESQMELNDLLEEEDSEPVNVISFGPRFTD